MGVRHLGQAKGFNKQTRRRGSDPAFPRLLGERLCLNYVNTVESPLGSSPDDRLHTYSDLVRWGHHVGIFDDSMTNHLLREGAHRPDEAVVVFDRSLALRATLTRIFRAIAHRTTPAEPDLHQLRVEYLAALDRAQLAPAGSGFEWTWRAEDLALDRPLWAISRSAVAVLTIDELARVKECPGAGDCGWLFYDTSKNGSRRWCSMEGCGSRVKMRQYYTRHRDASAD